MPALIISCIYLRWRVPGNKISNVCIKGSIFSIHDHGLYVQEIITKLKGMEREQSIVAYKQVPPPDYLRNYVRYFWTLESNGADPLPKTLGPLVDGCPGLIFHQPEGSSFYDQCDKQLPGTFLYGQTITRTELYVTGKFKLIGITFFPNALKYIAGFNANELTDTCLDLSLLPFTRRANILDQLLNSRTTGEQIEILSTYLFSLIRKNNLPVDRITHYAQSQIIQARGNISLKDLQRNLKLSERSFERKFEQYVGISPKLFSRVCRFQASLDQLRSNNYTNLSDIAFDNGYADQSHFIKSFKEFAGYSPREFQKQSIEVVEIVPVLIK
jgi:AraC-like DNA-binding protein